ncbi:MAG: hypothetical protein HY782_14070 [Chloroflexi bacterium]|nr:hypothetical protein [Chloroflexota bacterium]
MSRDFLLVLGGGVVSLVTTLIVLFITDWVYRRDALRRLTGNQPGVAQQQSGEKEAST